MRLGVSCIKKRNVAKETCSKTEELCLNMAISYGNIGLCMKKTFSAVGCVRMWQEENAGMERLSEEAKQEEIKSGKREVEREGERVEIKRTCLNRVSSDFFEDVSPKVCARGVFFCDCCSCCACFPPFGCECDR